MILPIQIVNFHSFWYVYQRGSRGVILAISHRWVNPLFSPSLSSFRDPRPPTFGILQHSTTRRLEASSWRLLKAASIGGAIFKQINKSTTVTGQSARLPISANADMISWVMGNFPQLGKCHEDEGNKSCWDANGNQVSGFISAVFIYSLTSGLGWKTFGANESEQFITLALTHTMLSASTDLYPYKFDTAECRVVSTSMQTANLIHPYFKLYIY